MKKGQNFNRPAKGRKIKIEPIRNSKYIDKIKDLVSDNPRNLCLFTLGINTSLRPIDLLSIKVAQVQDVSLTNTIELVESKNDHIRQIAINMDCVASICHLIAAREKKEGKPLNSDVYLFTCPRGSLSVSYLNNLVKKWCAEVNLKGNYGGQTLRKTFGYQQLFQRGMSIHELMVIFNHFTHRQTLEYLCIRPEAADEINRDVELKTRGLLERTLPHDVMLLKKENAELRKSIDVLKQSEKKFKTFFENAKDEIVYIDKSGKIIEVNEATRDIFGWTRKESLGKYFWDIGLFKAKDVNLIKEGFLQNVQDGKSTEAIEVEALHKEKRPIFIEVKSVMFG